VKPTDTPIGIFDSGLGGLSILRAICERLPSESVIYVADSSYAPYGERTDDFIRERSAALTEWLLDKRIKLLVVACNTATTHAIKDLRGRFAIPIVGVEPGIKPAVIASAAGIVGVVATAATLRSDRLLTLISLYEDSCRFVCQPGHGLVELIERGGVHGEAIDALLLRYLTPMAEAGADTVILGSTHFALLIPNIRRLFGDLFHLVETGPAVARRVDQVLTERELLAASACRGSLHFHSTAFAETGRAPLAQIVGSLFDAKCDIADAKIGAGSAST
jgi:glutamate racemase